MTRLIGGSAGGRTLKVPPRGTRPTTEKVREALFSRLDHLVGLDGARFLDLYAGSGAVAFEAASRGAAAVAVESAGSALAVIKANAASLGLPLEVVRAKVEHYLAGDPPATPFDIVFADPPYAIGPDALTAVLAALARPGWLAPDAVVILETERRAEPPAPPGAWPAATVKQYGETLLHYVHLRELPEDAGAGAAATRRARRGDAEADRPGSDDHGAAPHAR